MTKKQIHTGHGKVSFDWNEQDRSFTFHGVPTVYRARDLEHARTMVRAWAEAGTLPRPAGPDQESQPGT
jgi:hypothetical protein